METIQRWLTPKEAATLLGMDIDLVREFMCQGIIRAKDIARPGAIHRRWRTTLQWLREYQESDTTTTSIRSAFETAGHAVARVISGVSYREWRGKRRAGGSRNGK